ncbi:MAG: HU family DNA-binding protein [Gemmatimonadota bacterium]|nr:HU family DNA-binding protein [Gemmatimonadota bacterium]
MTKDEFAAKLAKRTDLTKTKAREVIDTIFGTDSGAGIIATELDAGRDFTVTGFGRFGTRRMTARPGRNPQSGEPLWISARTIPTFKAGKGLKERVADAPEPAPSSQPREHAFRQTAFV